MKHAYAQRTWLKCNTLVRHNVPTSRGAIYDQAAAVKGSDTASSRSGEGAGVADTPTRRIDIRGSVLNSMYFA